MKFNFAKTLLMSTALTMGAFGLVACGGDNGSSAKTPHDESITIKGEEALIAGTIVKFSGTITTDNSNPDIDQDADFAIDKLVLQVIDEKEKVTKVVPTPDTYQAEANVDKLDLSYIGATVMLDDPNFTTCGIFKLNVIVYAHLDKDSKVSSVQIPFERNAERFCPAAPASSAGGGSAASTEIEMTTYTVDMSTDQLPGLDLASGKASNSTTADILLSKVKDGVAITSGNGTLFTPIANEQITPSNWDDDYMVDCWPEVENNRPAYLSDFKVRTVTKTQIADAVDGGSPSQEIYVALTPNGDLTTGAGVYAFGITDAKEGLNGNFNVTLKVYKKK